MGTCDNLGHLRIHYVLNKWKLFPPFIPRLHGFENLFYSFRKIGDWAFLPVHNCKAHFGFRNNMRSHVPWHRGSSAIIMINRNALCQLLKNTKEGKESNQNGKVRLFSHPLWVLKWRLREVNHLPYVTQQVTLKSSCIIIIYFLFHFAFLCCTLLGLI